MLQCVEEGAIRVYKAFSMRAQYLGPLLEGYQLKNDLFYAGWGRQVEGLLCDVNPKP